MNDYTRTYIVPPNTIEFHFVYNDSFGQMPFDFEIISKDLAIEYGFEDVQEQGVLRASTVEFDIDDISNNNYALLSHLYKKYFDLTNFFPVDFTTVFYLDIIFNGTRLWRGKLENITRDIKKNECKLLFNDAQTEIFHASWLSKGVSDYFSNVDDGRNFLYGMNRIINKRKVYVSNNEQSLDDVAAYGCQFGFSLVPIQNTWLVIPSDHGFTPTSLNDFYGITNNYFPLRKFIMSLYTMVNPDINDANGNFYCNHYFNGVTQDLGGGNRDTIQFSGFRDNDFLIVELHRKIFGYYIICKQSWRTQQVFDISKWFTLQNTESIGPDGQKTIYETWVFDPVAYYNRSSPVAQGSNYNFECGGILKRLSQNLFASTGMTDYDHAYFVQKDYQGIDAYAPIILTQNDLISDAVNGEAGTIQLDPIGFTRVHVHHTDTYRFIDDAEAGVGVNKNNIDIDFDFVGSGDLSSTYSGFRYAQDDGQGTWHVWPFYSVNGFPDNKYGYGNGGQTAASMLAQKIYDRIIADRYKWHIEVDRIDNTFYLLMDVYCNINTVGDDNNVEHFIRCITMKKEIFKNKTTIDGIEFALSS